MDRQSLRKVRYYNRLHYPVHVTLGDDGLVGHHPDLPGCHHTSSDVGSLYAELDRKRRQWIAGRVANDLEIPLPNSHTVPKAIPVRKSIAIEPRSGRTLQPMAAAC